MTNLSPGLLAVVDRLRQVRDVPPPPALESYAARLYASMAPLAWLDGSTDWSLAKLAGAIGTMFQAVEDVARDTPAGPGWSAVVDLQRCPDSWLPWLAQFVGVTVIPGSTPDEMRERIVRTDGFRRGTPDALLAAAQATLTGTRTVYFRERDPSGADPPYTLEVVTLTDETPDPAATLAALIAQKPGGIVLRYRNVIGWDYQAMTTEGGKYSALPAKFATYRALTYNQRS